MGIGLWLGRGRGSKVNNFERIQGEQKGGGCPQVNRFEQVHSGHKGMLLIID